MKPPTPKPTICILDRTDLSVCLMNLVCQQVPHAGPEWDRICNTRDPKTPGVVTVELLINGVSIPDPIKGLTALVAEIEADIERLASARALQMVSKAGLEGIEEAMRKVRETMEQADWALRDALRKKAGATFYDDDSR